MSDDKVLVQVKVPVCVSVQMSPDDAAWMYRDQLAEIVDCVLRDLPSKMRPLTALLVSGQAVNCEVGIAPHWDTLPEDECEITSTDDEVLFPLSE